MPQRPVSQVIEQQEVVAVARTATVMEAVHLMKARHIGALMVVESDRLVGILSERDVVFRVVAEERDAKATVVADVMTANPETILPEKPFAHALHIMYEGGFRHVPVVDGNGRAVGMVSARDALDLEEHEFEEALKQREHIRVIL
ncbi:MAG: CBS domain-containing protein [Betaproteobacteria bacterium]|nr:CBS domain-containing protein [Betaproteobacteria bacterium]